MSVILGFLKHPLQLIAALSEGPVPFHPHAIAPIVHPVAVAATGASALTAPPVAALDGAPVALDSIAVPHGVCGWIPADNGSSDWVCQSMGQVMPGIVFCVSIAVILVTAFFLLRYLSRSLAAAVELGLLFKALSRYSTVGPHEWARRQQCDQVLAALQSSGKRVPPLGSFARKLQDSLLPVDSGASQLVLRRSIAELAGESGVIEPWTGRGLADALPGWLTAIGLMTTFIALLLGLQHVKVLANLEVRGIGGLVNGLSGKFFSSIIALGCAVSVSIANHFLTGITAPRWQRVLERLDELLPHLSAERVFFQARAGWEQQQPQPAVEPVSLRAGQER